MMSLQERVVQKVNGLSEDNLQFLLEMIERFMWTDSTEEKTGDEGTLTPTVNARFYVYPPKKKSDILYLVTDNPRTIVYNYFYTS